MTHLEDFLASRGREQLKRDRDALLDAVDITMRTAMRGTCRANRRMLFEQARITAKAYRVTVELLGP